MNDKILHAALGAIICFVVALVSSFFFPVPILIGFWVAFAIGMLNKHGTPELLDFLATVAGAFVVAVLLEALGVLK